MVVVFRTQLLCRCIELSRDQGYTKYLALAQLREGLDAIKVYEKAVEILIRDASLSVAGTEVCCLPSWSGRDWPSACVLRGAAPVQFCTSPRNAPRCAGSCRLRSVP